MAKIHSSKVKPRCFPLNGDVEDAEIDRVQNIVPSPTPNREPVNEFGRVDQVGYVKQRFEVPYALTQYEYGNMEFYKKLANKAASVETLTLADFKTSALDIAAYLTDDDDTFVGTLWYPKLRTAGFTLDISDPNSIVERNFSLIGDAVNRWQGLNKYVIFHKQTLGSGETGDVAIDLSAREPAEDPRQPAGDNTDYFIRVVRVRGTTTTELSYTTGYTYVPGTQIITIKSSQIGDVIKIWYTSATAPATMFTLNDADPVALSAPFVSIYLYIPGSGKPASGDYLYRLQNITLDIALEREDLGEIGSELVTERGVADNTVSVSLSRRNSINSLEELLSGQVAGYGNIDFNQFSNSNAIIVKFFKEAAKTTFAYGFKITGLAATGLGGGQAVKEYLIREGTLESKNCTITENAATLGI